MRRGGRFIITKFKKRIQEWFLMMREVGRNRENVDCKNIIFHLLAVGYQNILFNLIIYTNFNELAVYMSHSIVCSLHEKFLDFGNV